jgi:hypothetical protein
MSMRGEEMFHRLRQREFQIHHAAVAQHHDEEAQASPGRSNSDRSVFTPIDLGAFSGSK